MKALVL